MISYSKIIFDQICQLRERRIDLEEALFEAKKATDAMKKELDTLVKKVKVVEVALKNAGADLEAFQVYKSSLPCSYNLGHKYLRKCETHARIRSFYQRKNVLIQAESQRA